MWEENTKIEISNLASKITRYTLLATLLFTAGLSVLADEFVPIYYSSEFTDSILPLQILLPGALFFAVVRPVIAIGQGKGELKPVVAATGLAAGINIILNIILIPNYGIAGAATATSIGYGSMLVFHHYSARYIGYNAFTDLRLLRTSASAGGLYFCITLVDYASPTDTISLLLVPPIGLVVYTVFIVKTGALDSDELLAVAKRAPTPLRSHLEKYINK
jgi:O-antigen/teichoic acid export membrane protein